MQIEVAPNPNCAGSEQYVFNEIEAPKPVLGLKFEDRGKEILCDLTGVAAGGEFTQAYAVKITDSGSGFAYLIFGAEWGIRIRPRKSPTQPWDLANEGQWGEPFKIYGDTEDILYA